MERILTELKEHTLAWAFLHPVNSEDVPDYALVIKNPMGTYQFFIQSTT